MEISKIRIAAHTPVLAIFGLLLSCSTPSETSKACPLTVDTATTILTKKNKGTEYFLVKRITGWQDKTIIIQLFDKKPQVDECNVDLIKPVFEDSIDLDTTLLKVTANISKNEFNLTYATTKLDHTNITLEFVE